MTTIRIESDAESDRGKTFAGQKINIVPKIKKKRSSGGGSSSSSTKTVVYIVSDSPADVGRTFAGQKILTPQEFEQVRRSSGSSVNAVSRQPTAQEKATIQAQIRQETLARQLQAQREAKAKQQAETQKIRLTNIKESKQNLQSQIIKNSQSRKLTNNELRVLGYSEKQIEAINTPNLTNQKALSMGLNMKQISEVGNIQLRRSYFDKIQKEVEQSKKQFEQNLGAFAKVLTPQQKETLYNSQFVSTPSIPIPIQKQLDQIDKRKDLNVFEKEILKRNTIGILTNSKGGQRGFFDNPTAVEIKEQANVFGVAPSQKTNKYKQFENYLADEYKRIRDKPVDKRTNKEMLTIALYGLGATGLGTIRKTPQVVLDTIVSFLRPDEVVKSVWKITTDKDTRAELMRKKDELSMGLQRGDPDAFSTLLSQILGYKVGVKTIDKGISTVRQVPKLSPYYTRVKEFMGRTPQEMGASNKLIKAVGEKDIKAYSVSRGKVKDLFENKGFLEVKPVGGGGIDRVYYWAENYLPDLKLPLGGGGATYKGKRINAKGIEKALQQEAGLSKSKINELKTKLGEDHFYLGNNQVYSYYAMPRKGGVGQAVVLVEGNVLKFPKSIMQRVKNLNSLNELQKVKLRSDINSFIKRNPGKLALSPRTLAKGFGEFEVVAPVGSKLFRVQNLRTKAYGLLGIKKGSKFTYLKQTDKFIELAEATFKKPLKEPTLKELIKDFGSKLKKKYSIVEMKKDLKNWYDSKFTKSGKKQKLLETKRERALEKKLLEGEKKELQKLEKQIKDNKKLTSKQKDKYLKEISRRKKELINSRKGVKTRDIVKRLTVFKSKLRNNIRNQTQRNTPKNSIRTNNRPLKGGRTPKVTRPSGGRPPKPPSGGRPPKPPSGGRPPKPPSDGRLPKPPSGGRPPKPPSGGRNGGGSSTNKKIRKILNNKKKGQRTAYNVEYKQSSRWKTEDVELPLNRAIKRGKIRASQRITQSVRIKPIGTTSLKDIKKPDLQGFKIKKRGNVIVLVEVRKQAISTVTEKAELKIARKNKKTNSKIKKALKKAKSKKKVSAPSKKKSSNAIKKALKKKISSSKKKSTSNKIKKAIKKTVKKSKSTKKVKKMTKKTPKYKKSPKKAPKKKIVKKKTIKKKSKKR